MKLDELRQTLQEEPDQPSACICCGTTIATLIEHADFGMVCFPCRRTCYTEAISEYIRCMINRHT